MVCPSSRGGRWYATNPQSMRGRDVPKISDHFPRFTLEPTTHWKNPPDSSASTKAQSVARSGIDSARLAGAISCHLRFRCIRHNVHMPREQKAAQAGNGHVHAGPLLFHGGQTSQRVTLWPSMVHSMRGSSRRPDQFLRRHSPRTMRSTCFSSSLLNDVAVLDCPQQTDITDRREAWSPADLDGRAPGSAALG